MSFLDKIVSAVAPPETDEERMEVRQNARQMAGTSGWMSMAISHHDQIESSFEAARSSTTEVEALAAFKQLATLLTAHSIAEETVLYPALVIEGHKMHAGTAYEEHQMAKIQMAELERLTPLSQEWHDKLEHVRGAVLHHIYEEEKTWFPEIAQKASGTDQALLDVRFAEEFERSMGRAPA
jgi:hypothetical protein